MQRTEKQILGNSHRTGPYRRACPSADGPAQPTSTPRLGGPLAAALGILACCVPPARGAPPSSDQLVGMAIDAVRSNYALIESAKCTLREIRTDATAAKPGVAVRKMPGGGQVRVVHWPRMQWDVRVTLRGDDLRVDRKPAGSAAGFGPETRMFSKGIWTQYTPGSSSAWVHRTEDMPGMFPLDPRQLGSDDARRSVLDILREDRIVSAGLATSTDGKAIVQIVARTARGVRTTYEFDSEANFLPTRFWTNWPDGSVLQLVEIQYQDVLDGRAKFLKKLTRRFFAQAVTQVPSASGWRESFSREVVAIVLNGPVAADTFQLDLPPGTRVSDNTRQAIYAASALPTKRPIGRWAYILGIVHLSILLVCVRVYKAKKGRRRVDV